MAFSFTDKACYVKGVVANGSNGLLVLAMDDLNAQEIPHSFFLVSVGAKLKPLCSRPYYSRYITYLKELEEYVVISEGGECLVVSKCGDEKDELIRIEGVSLGYRGALRGGTSIGNEIVVVGMDRQVYRRAANGVWRLMENGLVRPELGEVAGFEAVDGIDSKILYAVGWNGEIWIYSDESWRQVKSPTNRILTDVCVGETGIAYACGRNGLMLMGRDEHWEILTIKCPDDLWSLAYFKGAIYAASLWRLYKLVDNSLELISNEQTGASTYSKLSVSDDVLWSIGAKDVVAYDGISWKHIG